MWEHPGRVDMHVHVNVDMCVDMYNVNPVGVPEDMWDICECMW